MSVVIIGGNECMTRRYKDTCEEYDCDAKVYAKMSDGIRGIGSPDLIVLFTATMSHKMLHAVIRETKGQDVRIARSQSSSVSALKNLLEEHTGSLRN